MDISLKEKVVSADAKELIGITLKFKNNMGNHENHRIVVEGEPTCETCASFNGAKCLSCGTTIGTTFKHNTCKYHLVMLEIKYLPLLRDGFYLRTSERSQFLS